MIVWDTATFREIRSFAVTNPDLQGMAISPDGGRLAIAGHGTIIRSLVTGRELARLDRNGVRPVAPFLTTGKPWPRAAGGARWSSGRLAPGAHVHFPDE